MSRNRETPSDSSEEDDEVTSEEDSDSGLEPQQTQSAMARPLLRLPPPSSSSSPEESDTDLMQRPLAAKPMKEIRLKPVDDSNLRFMLVRVSHGINSSDAADVVTPKCDVEDARAALRDAKKSETSDRKSNRFQRIWSKDDEIVILKGMIDYLAKYKTDPTQDIGMFHSFIKEELQTYGSQMQLLDKIRRMKKKFEKKIKNGKEMTFSKPHEQSVYDLSKMIWGNKEKPVVVNSGMVRRSDRKKESEKAVEKKKRRVDLNYPGAMTMNEKLLMDGGDLFESGQGLNGEKEWKKLRVEELQNYLKQLEVRVAQTKLILAAMVKHS
ncbi:hypothetical protein SASPL_127104 [Salvia splendens]|uniref:Glabrous enhancer-binding protein-like DBD domain-containing protein n=1 Tax=Salvia splendens TaxID=180675 RepID=A0A8X8XK89_SALSN|nr:probable transcription factor At1g11510 [Salvia splendens]KAG6414382.1 hypothetical protein SASPL_127104 [Salvia splendens]